MSECSFLCDKEKSTFSGDCQRDKIQVIVRDISGHIYCINTNKYDKITDIKENIFYKTGFRVSTQNLFINGAQVDDEKSVEDYDCIDVVADLRGGMQISVKTLEGKIYTFEVSQTETVQAIKNKIYEKSAIEPKKQKLVYHGSILQDNQTIQEADITNQSVVNLVITASEEIQIEVQYQENSNIFLNVDKTDKISEIKRKISKAINVDVQNQTLLFHANILQNQKSLVNYDVQDKDVINLIIDSKTNFIIYIVVAVLVFIVAFEFYRFVFGK